MAQCDLAQGCWLYIWEGGQFHVSSGNTCKRKCTYPLHCMLRIIPELIQRRICQSVSMGERDLASGVRRLVPQPAIRYTTAAGSTVEPTRYAMPARPTSHRIAMDVLFAIIGLGQIHVSRLADRTGLCRA